MKKIIQRYIHFFDPLVALFAAIGFMGLLARRVLSFSARPLKLTRSTFRNLGYLPIRDHYYEPLTFDAQGYKYRDRIAQILFDGQRDFSWLQQIARPAEFNLAMNDGLLKDSGFKFCNGTFEAGDAEVLFYAVRHHKPKKVIEIGAGNSSRVIHAALALNRSEGDDGAHIIIEPYENPWLEQLGAQVIRKKVEEIDMGLFESLEASDILFIDSSHVIRAQNDCVFEYTELLPVLKQGVLVHIHDIFTPFDYPENWLNQIIHLWGEQYMLEALLANSKSWEILGPLHWLSQDSERFKTYCPSFNEGHLPGSFWIQKR